MRENLVKLDQAIHDQRKVVDEMRLDFTASESVNDIVADMRHQAIEDVVRGRVGKHADCEPDSALGLQADLEDLLGLKLEVTAWLSERGMREEEVIERIRRAAEERALELATSAPDDERECHRAVLLRTLDH